jgi:hypothetical protein
MFLGLLVTFLIGVSAGAVIDNQYPEVGKTITQQEQAAKH